MIVPSPSQVGEIIGLLIEVDAVDALTNRPLCSLQPFLLPFAYEETTTEEPPDNSEDSKLLFLLADEFTFFAF